MKDIKENPRFITMPQVHPAQVDCLCDVPGYIFMENWKDIPGYVGLYKASNLGRIKSISREVCAGRNGGVKYVNEKLKKPYCNKKRYGYYYIHLLNKSYSLHRIIWITFNHSIPDNLEINHIDGNKGNNNLDNLELVTSSQNKIHAYKLGLKKPLKSKDNHKSKSIYCSTICGEIVKRFDCIGDAGRDGYRKSSIIACLKSRNKTYMKLMWKYES